MAGSSISKRIVAAAVLAVLGSEGCGEGATRSGVAGAQERDAKRQVILDDARKKREARTAELRSLDVAALSRELAADAAKGTEPFNSLPFAEMISRGEPAAATLAPLIRSADRTSLLALLALRRLSPKQYQVVSPALRVNILVDALRSSQTFNTWGLPHLRWEEAARALIEEGAAADAPLRALLADKRDAPVWGGEDAAEYRRYRYRVCDYAWALLNEISGRVETIPLDPAERDRQQSGVKPS